MPRPRALGGLLLAMLMYEVVIRHLAFGQPMLDPQLGWIWHKVTVVHRLNEGWGISHWDAQGARVLPHTHPDRPRILVLGDSFTEALQVNDDQVFSARLQGVNAINVGQSGRSLADYVAFANVYRERYHPDWTVIEIGAEDLSDDSFNPAKTHFNNDLTLTIEQPHYGRISTVLMRMRHYCAVLDYGIARWDIYRATAKMPPMFHAADTDRGDRGAPVAAASKTWPVRDEVTRVISSFGGRVTFMFIPSFNGYIPPVEQSFTDSCRANAWSCVNLRDAFGAFTSNGTAPMGFKNSRFGAGHMNAAGHASAATLLQHELERLRARGLF